MTAIVLVSTFQKDRAGTAQGQAYEPMSKFASVYENLGSGKDAFEPFKNLRK